MSAITNLNLSLRKTARMRTRCLIEECEGIAYARGLCTKCWRAARSAVNDGRYTWDYLEDIGMSLKPGTHKVYEIPLHIQKKDKYYKLLYEKINEGRNYKDYLHG